MSRLGCVGGVGGIGSRGGGGVIERSVAAALALHESERWRARARVDTLVNQHACANPTNHVHWRTLSHSAASGRNLPDGDCRPCSRIHGIRICGQAIAWAVEVLSRRPRRVDHPTRRRSHERGAAQGRPATEARGDDAAARSTSCGKYAGVEGRPCRSAGAQTR